MVARHSLRFKHFTLSVFTVILSLSFLSASAQEKIIDGKEFSRYKPGAFRPKRGLFYMLYLSPVLTVDPLGLGGKSTYALSLGTRINLWESKSPNLKGLKIQGWYLGGGYEYYPQQFDMAYVSAWMRVKTFLPVVGKIDWIYAFDNVSSGVMARYSIGIEIKKITFFACGSIYYKKEGEQHPVYNSEYTTAGSLLLIIPIYTRD